MFDARCYDAPIRQLNDEAVMMMKDEMTASMSGEQPPR